MSNLNYRLIALFLFSNCILFNINAQSNNSYWIDIEEVSVEQTDVRDYRALKLNSNLLLNELQKAAEEFTPEVFSNPTIVNFPMPDGKMQDFIIAKSFIMEDGLAAKYPYIKSFIAKGIDDPTAVARILSTSGGIEIHILSQQGSIKIKPAEKGSDEYISYFRKDRISNDVPFICGNTKKDNNINSYGFPKSGNTGEVLRIFRIGIAATGEFTQVVGGAANALDAIVIAVSEANLIFERDFTIRLVLVDNNDQIIFTDPETDPYTDGTTGYECLYDTPDVLNNYIGANNYDIAHTFTGGCTDVGGVAFGGSTCENDAGGMTCRSDADFYDTMIHEIGHQFSGSHTWSNCNEDNIGQLTPNSAYEPGSGSTLLSYAGACGDNNVTGDNDFYFHNRNLRQVNSFLNDDGACFETMVTGNTAPEVNLFSGGFYIPISTPFELEASATDVDGDGLTYCWEQYNLGPTTELGQPVGTAPSFRSYRPKDTPIRLFPNRLAIILQNSLSTREVLPTYNRDLTFVCTVRDNFMGSGGVTYEQVSFNATTAAGPFKITYPDQTETFEEGQTIEVLWDVANTDASPINCSTVNISLSTDFAVSFPFMLAENTPNDGSEFVTIPYGTTTVLGRIKVKSANNIFLDINNRNMTIVEGNPNATNDIENLEQISIMPNPAKDQIRIVLDEPIQEVTTIGIYDLQGKLLKTKNFESIADLVEIEIADLSEAIYILKVNTASKQFVEKFVVYR